MTDNILINLSIISKISLDNKIYMNDEGYISIENNTIFQGFVRFVFRNSRGKTINNLNNFYNGVFNYIDNAIPHSCNMQFSMNSSTNKHEDKDFLSYKDKDYGLKTLLLYLRKSLSGLENLKETYSGDIVMTSKLDIIIDNVRLYSDKLEKKIQNYV
jgi:hypothetical protein